MRRLLVIGLILVVGLSGTQGANRYVSPNGSNTSPYDTWAKAAQHPNVLNGVTAAGDSVLIAPAQYDTVDIRPPRAGTTFTVYTCSTATEAYRSATILSGGWTPAGTWYQRGSTNIYTYSATVPPRWNAYQSYTTALAQDGVMAHSVTRSSAQDLDDLDEAGEYFYDDTGTDSIYFWPFGGGDPDSYAIRFSQHPVVRFMFGDQDRIKFIYLTMEMSAKSVVTLCHSDGNSDVSDSVWFYNCNLWRAGDTYAANNTGVIGSGLPSGAAPSAINDWGRFLHIVACSIDHAWSPDNDLSGGFGFETYSQREFLIQNNWFGPNLKAGGIGFKNGSTETATWCFGGVVIGNTIMGGRVGMWLGPKIDSLIVCGNYIQSSGYRGIDIHSTFSNVIYPGRIKIFNNTIWNPTGATAGGEAITISQMPGDSTLRNEIKYNIIFDTTSVIRAIGFVDQEATVRNPEPYWDIDSNMYYHSPGAFSSRFYAGSPCSGTDWTAWLACFRGFDAHSTNSTNPNFTASQTPVLSREGTSEEMNRTYAGQTWTRFGAWQPSAPAEYKRIRMKVR